MNENYSAAVGRAYLERGGLLYSHKNHQKEFLQKALESWAHATSQWQGEEDSYWSYAYKYSQVKRFLALYIFAEEPDEAQAQKHYERLLRFIELFTAIALHRKQSQALRPHLSPLGYLRLRLFLAPVGLPSGGLSNLLERAIAKREWLRRAFEGQDMAYFLEPGQLRKTFTLLQKAQLRGLQLPPDFREAVRSEEAAQLAKLDYRTPKEALAYLLQVRKDLLRLSAERNVDYIFAETAKGSRKTVLTWLVHCQTNLQGFLLAYEEYRRDLRDTEANEQKSQRDNVEVFLLELDRVHALLTPRYRALHELFVECVKQYTNTTFSYTGAAPVELSTALTELYSAPSELAYYRRKLLQLQVSIPAAANKDQALSLVDSFENELAVQELLAGDEAEAVLPVWL